MTDNQTSNVVVPSSSDTLNAQPVEGSQTTSISNESPCEDRGLPGHAQWSCNKCLEHFDRECDQVLRGSMLSYQGWTEKQVDAIGSFRRFDKTPWTDLTPDLNQPKSVQSRTWGLNCVKELQARVDAAREFHEIMTAQHHLQNQSKAKLIESSTNGVMCKDNEGNELHPQWTCQHCLTRLNDSFDKLLREAMLDQGWSEAQIDAAGSLRRFDSKPWSEMTPDPSQSQLDQVHAWGETRLDELEARMTNSTNVHNLRIESDEVADGPETK